MQKWVQVWTHFFNSPEEISPIVKAKKRYQPKKLTPEQIQSIEDQAYEQAEVIVSANYFVVDVKMELENGRWYLRVYLDHPNPAVRVSLDDCKDISEALNPMIDENIRELHEFPYSLEVSSPGLFRKLEKPREFQFYRGRRIEITPKGEKPYIAYLDSYNRESDALVLRLAKDEESETQELPWNPKTTQVTLSPDLTEKIETKTVPRRITRYD
jgi:ribosome maturation factor RimP